MQAYKGYVENGQFYPIGQIIRTSRRIDAVVTLLEEPKIEKPDTWAEVDRLASEMTEDEKPRFEDFPRFDLGRKLIDFEEI